MEYRDMLFFDDEYGNVEDISSLGKGSSRAEIDIIWRILRFCAKPSEFPLYRVCAVAMAPLTLRLLQYYSSFLGGGGRNSAQRNKFTSYSVPHGSWSISPSAVLWLVTLFLASGVTCYYIEDDQGITLSRFKEGLQQFSQS